MSRVVFVGEDNPYGADPHFALYHLPRYASGDNLRRHLGLKDHEYEEIYKVNLCQGKWAMKEARAAADRIIETATYDVIVMLGSKVKKAFEQEGQLPFTVFRAGAKVLIALPHPSGLNRIWNEAHAEDRARRLLTQYAPEIAWGPSQSG